MSGWSLDSLQHQVGRKLVPEGSNHFQLALDQILCSDDTQKQCFHDCSAIEASDLISVHNRNNENEGDIVDSLADLSEECKCDSLLAQTNTCDNNNNNFGDGIYDTKCSNRQYRQAHPIYGHFTNESEASTANHCFENGLSASQIEPTKYIYTIQESDQDLIMGATCSSNIYDNREWHNLKGDGSHETTKPKKRGRLLKKLMSNEKPAENNQVPSDVCKCQHHESSNTDTEPATRPVDLHSNGLKNAFDKRTSLSPDDITVPCGQQLTSNRLSPNVDSSGHVQLTRVVGSGKARATANCDVSPHRLLTRRNNSPIGRSSGMDAKSANSAYYGERQRSYSWSNGKLGTKTSFKTNSLTVRSSNSVRIMKTNSPQAAGERVSKAPPTSTSATSKTLTKPPNVDIHAPECPLRLNQEDVPTISVSKTKGREEFDADLAPVQRRRAASESQTLRPRRLLPRTPDSYDQIQEHVHVRWADEEHGSSLSTSVFLSSIRPRSYSYGAMDNAPQRPILKKVAGF